MITDERLKELQELRGYSTAMMAKEVMDMATELLRLRPLVKRLVEDGERLADVVLELIDSSPYEQDKVIAAKALAQHKQTVEGL